MNFREMLVMVGPAGIICDHSIINPKTGRAKNNHWLKSTCGVLVTRGAEYTYDYKVGQQAQYESGELTTPQLMTVKGGNLIRANVTDDMIQGDWVVVTHEEVSDAFGE